MIRLVRDRHAPASYAVHVCSTCLRTVNAVLDMAATTRDRLMQYVAWREKAAALPGTTANQEQTAIGMEASPETPG
jgi:hypothetical protein